MIGDGKLEEIHIDYNKVSIGDRFSSRVVLSVVCWGSNINLQSIVPDFLQNFDLDIDFIISDTNSTSKLKPTTEQIVKASRDKIQV